MSQLALRLRQRLSGRLTREFAAFAFSTYLLQGTQFLSQLITAYLLGPSKFGVLSLVKLAVQYSGLLEFGIVHGLHREVPMLRGKGDDQQVRTAQDTALLAILVICLAILVWAWVVRLCFGWLPFTAYLGSIVTLVVSTHLYHYTQVRLKASLRFSLVTQQQIIYAVVFLPITVPLTIRWGIQGFLYGQAAAVGLSVIFIAVRTGCASILPKRFDWATLRYLVSVGLPLMLSAQVSNLMTSIDRWIVATLLGAESVGYYSLATMAFKAIVLVPSVVGQQLYPRLAEAYGRVPSSSTLWIWVKRWSGASLAFTLPVVVVGGVAIYWGVPTFLPEYEAGVLPCLLLLGGALFLPVVSAIEGMLAVVSKQVLHLVIEIAAMCVNVLLSWLFVGLGWEIAGVALATTVSYVMFSTVAALVGFGVVKKMQPT